VPASQESGEWGEGSVDIGDRWSNSSSTRSERKKKSEEKKKELFQALHTEQ